MNWVLPEGTDSGNATTHSWDTVKAALLMDIRDELQQMNRLLGCPRFLGIPRVLDAIRMNTRRRVRKPKPAKKIKRKSSSRSR